MTYSWAMDWKKLLTDLRNAGMSLDLIATKTGLASRGHVHNLLTDRQHNVTYDVGRKILEEHGKIPKRRKAKRHV